MFRLMVGGVLFVAHTSEDCLPPLNRSIVSKNLRQVWSPGYHSDGQGEKIAAVTIFAREAVLLAWDDNIVLIPIPSLFPNAARSRRQANNWTRTHMNRLRKTANFQEKQETGRSGSKGDRYDRDDRVAI